MSKVPESYYKDLLSSISEISAVIPQRSGLGLLLFFISVNDVAVNMLSIRRLFANDNSLQYSSNNILDIEHYLNHDLTYLESWTKKWILQFNLTKTKVDFFTTEQNCF